MSGVGGVGGVGGSQLPQGPESSSWKSLLSKLANDLSEAREAYLQGYTQTWGMWVDRAQSNMNLARNAIDKLNDPDLLKSYDALQDRIATLISNMYAGRDITSTLKELDGCTEDALHLSRGGTLTAQQQQMNRAIEALANILNEATVLGLKRVSLSMLSPFLTALSTMIGHAGMPSSIRSAVESLMTQLDNNATSQGVSVSMLNDGQATLEQMLSSLSKS